MLLDNLRNFFQVPKWMRYIISAVALLLILYFVDLDEVVQNLIGFPPTNMLYFFLLVGLGVLISAIRWKIIIQVSTNTDVSLSPLFILYAKSSFYSKFLPTSFGGDVYKILRLKGITNKQKIFTILADRAYGLFGMLILLILTVPTLFDLLGFHSFFGFLIYFSFLAIATWLGYLLFGKFKKTKYGVLLSDALFKEIVVSVKLISLSILYFLLAIALPIRIVFDAFGVSVKWSIFVCFLTLIYMSGLLPISINGLGIMESLYLILFSTVGISISIITAIALIVRVLSYLTFTLLYIPLHFVGDKVVLTSKRKD